MLHGWVRSWSPRVGVLVDEHRWKSGPHRDRHTERSKETKNRLTKKNVAAAAGGTANTDNQVRETESHMWLPRFRCMPSIHGGWAFCRCVSAAFPGLFFFCASVAERPEPENSKTMPHAQINKTRPLPLVLVGAHMSATLQ